MWVLDSTASIDAGLQLRPKGVLMLVFSSIIGEQATIERLRRRGFADVSVIDRRTGPLGPLMREQQALGTVPAHLDEEDLVVVRAEMAGG